ncbi:Poly(A)-specific ribonuclease PARN [Gryllus bimaculatus]|nr:Poly(A)-specific ribonuclease PARN [Gryllus bimaculatus]
MEVTRLNFGEIIPELENDITSSHFLAIDGEFTGLHTGQDFNAFDTPQQYYAKLRSGGMDFLLVQLGLCTFRYNKDTGQFTHKAYNFYVFPRPFSRSAPDPRFLCQSSSLDFLVSQGFDFNKLFKEGIPYLTEAEEKKLREQLEEKQKARANSSSSKNEDSSASIPIPEEHTELIEDVCVRINDFLSNDEQDELILDGYNGFVRKLIYQTVGERFDSRSMHVETRAIDNHNRALVFCTPLPESYSEFKELVTFMFPRILDTKYMSCMDPFKDQISSTVLGHLHKTLSGEPFELVNVAPAVEGRGYASAEEKAHEAGYDAYLTGVCFLTLANYLGSLEEPAKKPVLPNSPLLRPYINRLHLMRVQDVTFIDLTGEDAEPPRDHVFHVTFPKEWKTYDLTQLFSPFGSVYVSWLTEASAYVGLHRRDQAQLVLNTLTQSDTYSVERYTEHVKRIKQTQRQCRCHRSSHSSQIYSPRATSQQRKKRSLEVQLTSTVQPLSSSYNSARKRSRSFGDYSIHSIEPIPEEETEAEDSKSGKGTVAAVAGGLAKVKRKKGKQGATAMFLAAANISTGKRKQEFEECDSWE